MKDTARICLEPVDVLWSVAWKHAKARPTCRVISNDRLVLREIERIERQRKVHDDCVGAGDPKVVHHLGRADARYRLADQIAWCLAVGFAERVIGRANDRVIYIRWHESGMV